MLTVMIIQSQLLTFMIIQSQMLTDCLSSSNHSCWLLWSSNHSCWLLWSSNHRCWLSWSSNNRCWLFIITQSQLLTVMIIQSQMLTVYHHPIAAVDCHDHPITDVDCLWSSNHKWWLFIIIQSQLLTLMIIQSQILTVMIIQSQMLTAFDHPITDDDCLSSSNHSCWLLWSSNHRCWLSRSSNPFNSFLYMLLYLLHYITTISSFFFCSKQVTVYLWIMCHQFNIFLPIIPATSLDICSFLFPILTFDTLKFNIWLSTLNSQQWMLVPS